MISPISPPSTNFSPNMNIIPLELTPLILASGKLRIKVVINPLSFSLGKCTILVRTSRLSKPVFTNSLYALTGLSTSLNSFLGFFKISSTSSI